MDGGALPVRSSERVVSTHLLERRQVVSGQIADVFGFFRNPRNLEAITPPWLRFEVVSSTDASVRRGTEIEYRLRWQGFPMKWRSRISEYLDGVCFSDEMLEGPYRSWRHRHLFKEVSDGIEVVDSVKYELPLGVVGRFVHRALVRSQLEAIFDYRRQAIASAFTVLEKERRARAATPTSLSS